MGTEQGGPDQEAIARAEGERKEREALRQAYADNLKRFTQGVGKGSDKEIARRKREIAEARKWLEDRGVIVGSLEFIRGKSDEAMEWNGRVKLLRHKAGIGLQQVGLGVQVSELNMKALQEIGIPVDRLVEKGGVVPEPVVDERVERARRATEELNDLLIMPEGIVRNRLVGDWLKRNGSAVDTETRKKAIASMVAEREKEGPASELEKIMKITDLGTRANALRRWNTHYAAELSDTEEGKKLLAKAAESRKGGEVKPTTEDELDIREAMIAAVGRLSSMSDIDQALDAFKKDQTLHLTGLYGQKFIKSYEIELDAEFRARAELASIMSFWDDIAGKLSADADPYKDMSVAKIDQCKKISKSTYVWLTKNRQLQHNVVEDDELRGISSEAWQDAETKQFRNQMDVALTTLYKDINLIWKTRAEDRVAKIAEYAGRLHVSVDAMTLSWQLAEAECWPARMKIDFIAHPACRLVQLANHRFFKSADEKPTPGGSRLWVEYRREQEKRGNKLKPPFEPRKGNPWHIYKEEGEKLAKVGFECWPKFVPVLGPDGTQELDSEGKPKFLTKLDLKAGERSLDNGTYLADLGELLKNESFIDASCPQAETMTSISKGASAFNAIDAISSAEPKSLGVKNLKDLRDNLASALTRLDEEGDDITIRTENGRKQSGKYLLEWAKTILWISSWDNPALNDESRVSTVSDWLDLYQAIITAYDDDHNWGEFIGYGMDKELAAEAEALQFAGWFDGLFKKHSTIVLGKDKNRAPFMTPGRQKQDSTDLAKYNPGYWLGQIPYYGGLPVGGLAGLARVGVEQLYGKERRWWLKGIGRYVGGETGKSRGWRKWI